MLCCYQTAKARTLCVYLFFHSDGQPRCETTISTNGWSMEGDYFTASCEIQFKGIPKPTITWSGPKNYTAYQYSRDGYLWSEIRLYATRTMQNESFSALSHISSMWAYDYTTPALDVYCEYRSNYHWSGSNGANNYLFSSSGHNATRFQWNHYSIIIQHPSSPNDSCVYH